MKSIAAWKEIDWQGLTKHNITKLKSIMKEKGIDALIVHRIDNFQYLTGYMVPTDMNLLLYTHRQGAILLAGQEQPIMLAGAADILDLKNFWWIKDVRPVPIQLEPWPGIIKQVLSDYGLKEGKIALDPHMSYVLAEELKKELGSSYRYINADDILDEAKAVKNNEEIKVVRRAAALASAMVVTAKNNIKEGVREIDVALAAERTLTQYSPLSYPAYKTVVLSGDRAAYLDRVPSEKVICNGEIVMIDAGCRYKGYYSEFSRHVMVGKPTAEQKSLYKAAFESEQKAIEAIKPGVKVSEIDKIARSVITEAGFGPYQHPHITGHGQGLDIHDAPLIGDPLQKKEYTIKPGMVIAIEPAVFKPGVGGVRIEDVILVTDTGHEVLSKVNYEDKLLN